MMDEVLLQQALKLISKEKKIRALEKERAERLVKLEELNQE
ncbi:MAG: hypothetical protein NTW95_14565 [Candidatus Aminicenantes bacterium]|nr:hypothetical protein [Candidatus Aminicenantes bacterium]